MFFVRELQPEIRTRHLSLTRMGSDYWVDQLLFLDTLRNENQLAAEYVQVKKDFAEYYARTNHLDTEWKSEFVAKVLEKVKSVPKDSI